METIGGCIILNYSRIGKGKDIVFLHGWGGDKDSFLGVANFFVANYSCCMIDLYGFGKSAIDRPMDLYDYMQGVVEVLSKEGIEKPIVCGHSFGGRIAMLMAENNLTSGIILVDSAGLKPRFSIKKYAKIKAYKIKKRLGCDISNCGSNDYRMLGDVMKKTFINVVNFYQDKSLEKITIPTLIWWGKNDTETPLYMAKRMSKKIKNSYCCVVNGGHWAYIDNMRQFCNDMQNFLEIVYDDSFA